MIPQPPVLQLSSGNMDRHGVYLMDRGSAIYLWVGAAVNDTFCQDVFDVPNFTAIQDGMVSVYIVCNVIYYSFCVHSIWCAQLPGYSCGMYVL